MAKRKEFRLSLAMKFHLAMVAPLIAISTLVTVFTNSGLRENARELTHALKIQGVAKEILPLLLIQDDASKEMLIDPDALDAAAERKIEAYDQHKELLDRVKEESGSKEMAAIVDELAALDEKNLRPLDTKILETLFDDLGAARQLYFREYGPARESYEAGIRKLADLAASNALAAKKTMNEKNQGSLWQIVIALILGILVVIAVIVILARQVERSEANMKSLLGSLEEGIFFFDATGQIAKERSQALEVILPGSSQCSTLAEFLGKFCGTSPAQVQTCLELLWEDEDDGFFSDFGTTVSMLPKGLRREEEGKTQNVAFHFKQITGADGKLAKVVVVVDDITEQLQREQQARTQAERVRKVSKAAISTDAFAAFAKEATQLIERARAEMAKDIGAMDQKLLKRDLHTIKGSIGTYEFAAIAARIHEIEDKIGGGALENELDGVREEMAAIASTWEFEVRDVKNVLGISGDVSSLRVARHKISTLHQLAEARQDGELAKHVTSLERSSLMELFVHYDDYLRQLAERRDDKSVRLGVTADSEEMTIEEAQALDGALIHIFRNGLDHGIEAFDVREKAGKRPEGTITASCRRQSGQSLILEIRDDGGGIDGDRLAAKAVENGFWTDAQRQAASADEKINLIFAAGLSSKDEVTEVSGRGVGMDAVRAQIEDLGGKIEVTSKLGKGTVFTMTLPDRFATTRREESVGGSETHSEASRVMVIDDDLEVARLLEEVLSSYGYEIVRFTDPAEALGRLASVQPNLVITDYCMPGYDGAEFVDALRSRGVDVPVILSTGYVDRIADKSLFAVIMTKPYDLDQMAREVSTLLEGGPAARAS